MLIDVTRPLYRSLMGRLPTGIDRVNLAYIKHFYNQARACIVIGNNWAAFTKSHSAILFDNLLMLKNRLSLARVFASALVAGRAPFTPDILLNTGHTGLERKGYTASAKRRGLKPFYLLHDLIPITHPEYSKAGEPEHHIVRLSEMMQADGLILNSAATQAVFERYAKKMNATAPPFVVSLLAAAPLPPPHAITPQDKTYFVMLGTIEPRKNHLTLLNVWRRIVETMGNQAPRLIVIGQRGWDCEQIANMLDRCKQLRGFVTEIPKCSDADLATLLAHTRALLFPSFEEGYGLPLVEALSAGTPILASPLPVFKEIAEDIPDYIDPLDGCGWLRAILAYAAPNSAQREAQLQRLSAFSHPTWKTHFEKVEDFLNDISISAPRPPI